MIISPFVLMANGDSFKENKMSKNGILLELYLVRHGYSMTNAGIETRTPEERFDPLLTETGEMQAELLGKRFSSLALDCIISSGLKRAAATASAVIKHQPSNGAHKLEIHPIFTEWGITQEYPGKTITEIRKDYPWAVPAPGAEDFDRMIVHTNDETDDIMEKTGIALDYLRSRFKNGEKVMVVGHGKFNGFLIYKALGIPENHPITFSIYNTGVTKIVFYEKGKGKVMDTGLVYLNDHSHLLANFPDYSFNTI